ncbi:hypothetical protein FA95DRAFT_1604602 [Auriscalpium vulgare]|uniref:Uncharacterized protein n=1 Tax=Auriscalpium vulgare TaxID=40419 RepID=A0ACB8RYB6_9AGAM|nr:hypothetical protein FA95DRAFT_1604602 [Auriscalpium vulgare]
MADAPLPIPLEALRNLIVHGLNSLFAVRYSSLSAALICFWEYAITFDQEVELIWKSPWTKGKTIFLFIRYYTLASAIFNTCDAHPFEGKSWIIWEGGINALIVNVAIAQGLLILRVRALYNHSRRVTIVLLVCFILTMVASTAIMVNVIAHAPIAVVNIPPYQFCSFGKIPPYLATYFIPIYMLETLLASLAVYRWLKDVGMRVTSPWQGFGPRLLYVLVRDSVLYFFVMVALYTFNVVVWIKDPDLFEVPVVFIFAAATLLGQRLILNMRARTMLGTALDSMGGWRGEPIGSVEMSFARKESHGGSAAHNFVLSSSASSEAVTFSPSESQGLVEVMDDAEKITSSTRSFVLPFPASTQVNFSPVQSQGLLQAMEDTRNGPPSPTLLQTRRHGVRPLPPTPLFSPHPDKTPYSSA